MTFFYNRSFFLIGFRSKKCVTHIADAKFSFIAFKTKDRGTYFKFAVIIKQSIKTPCWSTATSLKIVVKTGLKKENKQQLNRHTDKFLRTNIKFCQSLKIVRKSEVMNRLQNRTIKSKIITSTTTDCTLSVNRRGQISPPIHILHDGKAIYYILYLDI